MLAEITGNMVIYISILVFFITKADSSRILVTSGQGICEHGICHKSEIINLESVDGPCQDWVDFPKRAAGATGALLKGYPLICGGQIWLESKTDKFWILMWHLIINSQIIEEIFITGPDSIQISDECYEMNENEVILFGKMMANRTFAASTIINDAFNRQTLWITGGQNDYYPIPQISILSSTEYITRFGESIQGV